MNPTGTSLNSLRSRCDRLLHHREAMQQRLVELTARRQECANYLEVADAVRDALDTLSDKLFGQVLGVVEQQLSRALQEVLEQPLQLKAVRNFRSGLACIDFHIERAGQKENIIDGQGGSVANVLSVGLRLLALTTLDAKVHRRFLVLDEQDCWLAPALVPRLVNIIREAGRALGFQVLLISHHDPGLFERYADRVYELKVSPEGEATAVLRSQADAGVLAARSDK